MNYYQNESDAVLDEVGSQSGGLSTEEAQHRLAANGKNKLAEGKKTPIIVKFFKQLSDPMIIILMIAAVVSLVLTLVQEASPSVQDFADVIIIAAVVLLNAILGVVQESKAEQAIEALQNMTEAHCKVLRDGKMQFVNSCDIVVGDIVLLEAGDSVPADCRILEVASCKVEEAALTGESVPVDKFEHAIDGKVALGDRKNMLYMGSTIAYGRAKAVVVATGMATEMGKIANVLAHAKEEETPLQIKMSQLSRVLTVGILIICVVMFAFNLVKAFVTNTVSAEVIINSFMVAVGLAVAAIPEGLATTVTIVLSIGVTNMSKKNAVIRKLTAVETLGCAEIICSDKTGTLTQNKMTVVDTYGDDKKLLATAMALCSDAQLNDGQAVGEPTECALVNYANAEGLAKDKLEASMPRVAEAPFDSMRKMMSTLHKVGNKVVQYTKGAPDEILKRCTKAVKDDKVVPLTDEMRAEILAANKAMADKALRVLAAALVYHDSLPEDVTPEAIEHDMVFVGLCGMIDPVRPEVIGAIQQCREAGIRPIMITGDHIDTAVAIAMQLGIITDPSQAILGSVLDTLSDEEFEQVIGNYSVYARVQPEHKVRIVNTWKKLGKVCAMTGDGVNDAPSIKSADIGVGMGITGTDVTKATADMVLSDDNFATIVTAVGEGRRIYDNIRKAIQFLLSSNLAEVIAVFIASICGFTLLLPSHLLWINLVTDCLPAVALGMEPAEKDTMSRLPRKKDENIFAGGLGINVVFHGIVLAGITLAAYFIGESIEHSGLQSNQGMTMAFLALSMAELFHAYNARSMHKSVFSLKSHNKLLWVAMISSLVLTTAVIFVPGVNSFFHFADANGNAIINFTEYVIALALAFSIIPIVELQKLVFRAFHRKKSK